MKIPTDRLEKWRELKSNGDYTHILTALGLPYTKSNCSRLSRVFSLGACTDQLFIAMNQFYTQKETDLFTLKKEPDAK